MSVYYSAAKINLFLQVEGKREDGYHELTSVMQSVSLFDRMDISFHEKEYDLDAGEVDLGSTEKNTVTRMWRLLKERFALPGEIRVRLEKNIPVGAGLAGGSGNGAAVLRAVCDEFGLTLLENEIKEICAKVGADVAFCFYGGTMLATGIGEELKRLPNLFPCELLLLNGGFHVSTPEIFSLYDEIASKVESVSVEPLLHALAHGSEEEVLSSLYNGLERVAFPRYPSLKALSSTLARMALPHLMSGSGPTVFAFTPPATARQLRAEDPGTLGKMFFVSPVDCGIFSEKEYHNMIF